MKAFVIDHNQVWADYEIERVPLREADIVLLWSDVTPLERGVVNLAHQLGKKAYVMQHGRRGSSRYFPPFNEEIHADKLLVWGERDRQALIEAGHDAEKIAVTGTTVFSHLRGRKKHEGTNVIFCPEHWDRPISENRRVTNKLHRLKNVRITSKIIEGHDPKEFINPISTDRRSDTHLAICANVLSTADLVVGVSESTFELLAQSMDIPVVIMTDWEPKTFGGDIRYYNYRRIVSEGAHKTDLKHLNETIGYALKHPEALREERRRVSEEEGGIHLDARAEIRRQLQK